MNEQNRGHEQQLSPLTLENLGMPRQHRSSRTSGRRSSASLRTPFGRWLGVASSSASTRGRGFTVTYEEVV